MTIKKVDFLEDKVNITYHLTMPRGEAEPDNILEIKYDSLYKLDEEPRDPKGLGEISRKEIYIPKCKKTVVLLFDHFMETSESSMDMMRRPYLKRGDKIKIPMM